VRRREGASSSADFGGFDQNEIDPPRDLIYDRRFRRLTENNGNKIAEGFMLVRVLEEASLEQMLPKELNLAGLFYQMPREGVAQVIP
jgi:hypothetical protein